MERRNFFTSLAILLVARKFKIPAAKAQVPMKVHCPQGTVELMVPELASLDEVDPKAALHFLNRGYRIQLATHVRDLMARRPETTQQEAQMIVDTWEPTLKRKWRKRPKPSVKLPHKEGAYTLKEMKAALRQYGL